MEQFVAVAVVVAFGLNLYNILKMLLAGELDKVATALGAYAIFIGLAFLLRASDFADSVALGEFNLATLNTWSTILFGASLAGTAGTVYDISSINTPTLGVKVHAEPQAPSPWSPSAN
jgi:hypothetical protein